MDAEPPQTSTLGAQLRRNAVALISLALAISSLGYNTWRNERTEYQRNVRNAAFRIIEDLSKLEETVFTLAWVRDETRDPSLEFAGWSRALAVKDISRLLPEPGPTEGRLVFESWEENFSALRIRGRPSADDRARAAEARGVVSDKIGEARAALINIVENLD